MSNNNPAEKAAEQAFKSVKECIDQKKDFILEAGAGAGKTYTLVQSLLYLIGKQGKELQQKNQKIACITFTNVAKNEIKSRINNNPVILSETIHTFCWSLIKDFQPCLRKELLSIDRWKDKIDEDNKIDNKIIKYELGYPKIKEKEVLLGHDDVIDLIIRLMSNSKFIDLFIDKYPILFIDEYQDTNINFTKALIEFFLDSKKGPLIGLFGDYWQKIYGNGCGKIDHPNLTIIGKRANFRSEKKIVQCLNRIRPDLTQEVSNPLSKGIIKIYHTNDWQGQRRNEAHWKDDLPPEVAHEKLTEVKSKLCNDGWNFEDSTNTKILMLTHNILADEQGYKNLSNIFPYKESFIKKENEVISFLADILEPVCEAYENKHYSEIFNILGNKYFIKNQTDKQKWVQNMNSLIEIRKTGTIGQVIDYLKSSQHPQLPERLEIKNNRIKSLEDENSTLTESEKKDLETFKKLKDISYSELIALNKFINEKTPFATNHGVKGAEFENVLVVFGGGWNQYNFNQMLEWQLGGVPDGKMESFERNRNLFYVVCSRAKKNLTLFFTQKLSDSALTTLSTWFKETPISLG